MLLLAENVNRLPPSASRRDIEASARAAQWAGFQIASIEPDYSRCGDAEGALSHLPEGSPRATFWLGYIPSSRRYREIYEACQRRGFHLPNSPDQHDRGMELDLAYPSLEGMTPLTATASSLEEALEQAASMTYPLFLKGAVQSLKSHGWGACVAQDEESLKAIVSRLYRSADRTRGKVILRELLDLRHDRVSGNGFPIGREYRVFVYLGKVLTRAYYWDCQDAFGKLTRPEEEAVERLALSAARALEIPFCSIDVGQDTQGRWWVIETADAQFSGLAPETVPGHWHRLANRVKTG